MSVSKNVRYKFQIQYQKIENTYYLNLKFAFYLASQSFGIYTLPIQNLVNIFLIPHSLTFGQDNLIRPKLLWIRWISHANSPSPCPWQLPQVVLFSFLVFSVICKIGNFSSGRYVGMVVQKCSCVLIFIHRVSSLSTNPPKVVVPHFLTPMMMTSGNLFFPTLSSGSCPLDQR